MTTTTKLPDWECVQWLQELKRTKKFPISKRATDHYLDRIIKDLEAHYGI